MLIQRIAQTTRVKRNHWPTGFSRRVPVITDSQGRLRDAKRPTRGPVTDLPLASSTIEPNSSA